MAAFLGDTAEMRKTLASDSILGRRPLLHRVLCARQSARPSRDRGQVYPRALARSATADERGRIEENWRHYELMRGRPGRAPRLSDSPVTGALYLAVLDGLFADGDSARGRAAAGALEAQLGRPLPAGDGDQVRARFAIGQYGLATGRADLARRAIADLRAARADSGSAWQTDCLAPTRSCSMPRWRRHTEQPAAGTSCASSIPCLPIRSGSIGVVWQPDRGSAPRGTGGDPGRPRGAPAALHRRSLRSPIT